MPDMFEIFEDNEQSYDEHAEQKLIQTNDVIDGTLGSICVANLIMAGILSHDQRHDARIIEKAKGIINATLSQERAARRLAKMIMSEPLQAEPSVSRKVLNPNDSGGVAWDKLKSKKQKPLEGKQGPNRQSVRQYQLNNGSDSLAEQIRIAVAGLRPKTTFYVKTIYEIMRQQGVYSPDSPHQTRERGHISNVLNRMVARQELAKPETGVFVKV